MLQLSQNPLLFFLEHRESLPSCIYHIYWNAGEVLLFLDKILPICKSLASSKKGRKALLSHILVRQLRVRYLISVRKEWSYNILVEEDWKCDAYTSTAPQCRCFWMCFFNLPLSNYTLPPWALQKPCWEKKGSINLFFSQMQHWSTKKYLQNILPFISIILSITKDFKSTTVELGVALTLWWKAEATALAGRQCCGQEIRVHWNN